MTTTSESTQITHPVQGKIAVAHKISLDENDILIFQLARPTNQLSKGYIEAAKAAVMPLIPEGKTAMFLGNDVEVHSLSEEVVTLIKMQGKI